MLIIFWAFLELQVIKNVAAQQKSNQQNFSFSLVSKRFLSSFKFQTNPPQRKRVEGLCVLVVVFFI